MLIAAICAAVAKFGVADQYNRLSEAERSYAEVHAQHKEMQQAIADYPAVEQEYRTYSRSWLTEDSGLAVSVDRLDVLDLLEDHMMTCGNVRSFSISGTTVFVSMSGMNLEEISVMFIDLQQQPIVKSASLNIASTADDLTEAMDFSVTIVLQPEEDSQ